MQTHPAVPAPTPKDVRPEPLQNLYIMFYRHGMNATLSKGFFCKGDLLEAQETAKKHCRIMGYKYIFTRPMVVNLDEEEHQKLNLRPDQEIAS